METFRPNENVRVTVDGAPVRGTVTRVDSSGVVPLISVFVGGATGTVRVPAAEVRHVTRWD